MLYEALLAYPATRTADILCPDICLATHGVAGILLVLLDSFTDPTLTIEIFRKQWRSDKLMIINRLLFHLFRCPLNVIIYYIFLLKYLILHKCLCKYVPEAKDCRVSIFFGVFVVCPKNIYRHRKD